MGAPRAHAAGRWQHATHAHPKDPPFAPPATHESWADGTHLIAIENWGREKSVFGECERRQAGALQGLGWRWGGCWLAIAPPPPLHLCVAPRVPPFLVCVRGVEVLGNEGGGGG